jgi:hypothetical protein
MPATLPANQWHSRQTSRSTDKKASFHATCSIQRSLQKEHISLDYISQGSNQSVTHQKRSNNVWLLATLPSTNRPLYSPAKHAASSTRPLTKSAPSRCNSQRPSGQSLPHIQAVHLCRHILARSQPDEALWASSLYSRQMPVLHAHSRRACSPGIHPLTTEQTTSLVRDQRDALVIKAFLLQHYCTTSKTFNKYLYMYNVKKCHPTHAHMHASVVLYLGQIFYPYKNCCT